MNELQRKELRHAIAVLADIMEGYSIELGANTMQKEKQLVNRVLDSSRKLRKYYDGLFKEHSEDYGFISDSIKEGIDKFYIENRDEETSNN